MEYGDDPPYPEHDGYAYDAEAGEWYAVDDPQESELETAPVEVPPGEPVRPLTETVVLSSQLQSIVEAAERAAGELRHDAERRAHDRIAEADRAADIRVQAAEDEAAEIVAEAHDRAAALAAEAVNTVDSIHAEAHATLREAQEKAKETIATARVDAREIVRAAHLATGAVMDDGSELSEQLRELSNSLRNNAERLLRDIRLAHGSMTARLDQVSPGADAFPRSRGRSEDDEASPPPPRRTRAADADAAVDFEVPDFVMGDE